MKNNIIEAANTWFYSKISSDVCLAHANNYYSTDDYVNLTDDQVVDIWIQEVVKQWWESFKGMEVVKLCEDSGFRFSAAITDENKAEMFLKYEIVSDKAEEWWDNLHSAEQFKYDCASKREVIDCYKKVHNLSNPKTVIEEDQNKGIFFAGNEMTDDEGNLPPMLQTIEQQVHDASNEEKELDQRAIKWWEDLLVKQREELFIAYKERVGVIDAKNRYELTDTQIRNIWEVAMKNGSESKEQDVFVRKGFDKYIKEECGIPSEYNRMYGHHLRSFEAGYKLRKAQDETLIKELHEALKRTRVLNLHLYEDGTVGNRVFNEIKSAMEKSIKHLNN